MRRQADEVASKVRDTCPGLRRGVSSKGAGSDTCTGRPGTNPRWRRRPQRPAEHRDSSGAGASPLEAGFRRRGRPSSRPKAGPGGATPGRSSALSAETRGPDRPDAGARGSSQEQADVADSARRGKCPDTCCRRRRPRACWRARVLRSHRRARQRLRAVRVRRSPADRAAEAYAVAVRAPLSHVGSRPAAGGSAGAAKRSSAPGWNPRPARCSRRRASSGSNGPKSCRRAKPGPASTCTRSAAQTDTAGLLYLTVGVVRARRGQRCSSTATRRSWALPRSVPGVRAAADARSGEPRSGTVVDARVAQLPRRRRRGAGGRSRPQARVSPRPRPPLTLDALEPCRMGGSGPHGARRGAGARRTGRPVRARLRTGCRQSSRGAGRCRPMQTDPDS